MRQQRMVLIKTNPDGTIKERYRVLKEDGFDPSPGYTEITKDEDKALISRNIQDVLYDHKSKRIKTKPIVKIVLSKGAITANGEDEVEVRLEGVPEAFKEVTIKIGNKKHKIDPSEPFYITMTNPQQLRVCLEEKTLKCDHIFVRGVKEKEEIK